MGVKFTAASSHFIDIASFNFSNQCSISYWAKATSTSTFAPIGSGVSPNEPFWVRHSTTVTVLWRQSGGIAINVVGGSLSSGVWYFITITGDGSDVNLYIDGVFVNSTSYDGTIVATSTNLWVGRLNSGGSNYFDGDIFGVRKYTRALLASEVQSLFHSEGADRITEGLTHRYSMDEGGDGSTASGANSIINIYGTNNGTPTNSPTYVAVPQRIG